MNTEKINTYLKTDDNTIINEKCIQWVKKIENCLFVCTKKNGCSKNHSMIHLSTHKICKLQNPASYHKLNSHFTPLKNSFIETTPRDMELELEPESEEYYK